MTAISVALCTYNGEKYLKGQLKSIATQTYPAKELVVCDDRSTDSTLQLVQDFIQLNPDLETKLVVNKQNLHFTGNFFKAASLCTGSHIAFSDQDDEWYAGKLEKLAAFIAAQSPELVIHRANVRDMVAGEGRETIAVPSMDLPLYHQELIHCVRSYSLGCCFVVQKSLIELFPRFWIWDEYLQHREQHGAFIGHDMLIFATAWARRSAIAIDDRLMDYRVHGANIFGRSSVEVERRSKEHTGWRWFAVSPDMLLAHARRLRSEHRILVKLAQEMDAPASDGVRALSEAVRRRSELLFLRTEIHSVKKSRAERAEAFMRNALAGNYFLGKQFFGVSRGTILKDFIAVLAAR